jgi:hypothetical protein
MCCAVLMICATLSDGPFKSCKFTWLLDLALDKSTGLVYAAGVNGRVLVINRKERTVTTLATTENGDLAGAIYVTLKNETLYLACPPRHTIYTVDIKSGE